MNPPHCMLLQHIILHPWIVEKPVPKKCWISHRFYMNVGCISRISGHKLKTLKFFSSWIRNDPYWLVVWNIFIFPYIRNVIIPTDFHIFQRGRSTTNQHKILMEFAHLQSHPGRKEPPPGASTVGLAEDVAGGGFTSQGNEGRSSPIWSGHVYGNFGDCNHSENSEWKWGSNMFKHVQVSCEERTKSIKPL